MVIQIDSVYLLKYPQRSISMKNPINLLLILVIAAVAQSCALYKIPKLAKQGEVVQTNYVQKIAFDYGHGLPFVEVTIKGKHYNFLFDTGAELSVIAKHIAGDIDYKLITSAKVNATNESDARLEFIEVPSITLANVDFEHTGAIIADLSHFDQYFGCKPIDGIIGSNLMRKATWQIDYKAREITITDSVERFVVSEKASVITMNAGKMRSVYLDVTIDSVSSRFIFDTGFNGKIKADSSFFNALKAKSKGLEFVTQSGLVVTDLNGKITGQTFMVIAKDIDVQGVEISDQMISLTGINKALVGNEFFENYTLTIDWQHDKLFLDPINEIKPDTLEAFEFSFSPNFISNKIEIIHFQDDYPLAEKVSADAEIMKINDRDVSNFTLEELCSYWSNEGEKLDELKTINLVLRDQGLTKNIQLTKKVLMPKS